MNAISKALSELHFKIPDRILNIAFKEHNSAIDNFISIDEAIMAKLMRPRVLVDCNLVGGVMVVIPINKCEVTWLQNQQYLIRVPKELTNKKSIISVLSIVGTSYYMPSSNSLAGQYVTNAADVSPVLSSGLNMMNNLANSPAVHTSRLELIGENIITVQDPTVGIFDGALRCNVENNTNLENINPKAYLAFSEMVALAAKSYVYNHCRIRIDQGYLYGGHELGIVNEIIETYSDAETMYVEYRETKWAKDAAMQNTEFMNRYIKSMFGNTF